MATNQYAIRLRMFPWRSFITWVFLGITFLLFIRQIPFFFGGGISKVGEYLAQHLFILLWMAVVTAANRTLPFSIVIFFWLLGVYPLMALNLLVGVPIGKTFGLNQPLAPAFILPFIEEMVKALPVLIYFAYLVWRKNWQPSATDGLLLGLALGAGFAFHEDALYRRVFGDGWDGTPLNFLFPTIGQRRPLIGGNLIAGYHAIEAALYGLAIGTAFLFRRYKVAWLIPPLVWLIVYFDHATFNFLLAPSTTRATGSIVFGLRTVVLNGLLPPLLLLIGVAVMTIVEQIILHKVGQRDRVFEKISSRRVMSTLLPFSWTSLRRWSSLREYVRARRAVHYVLWAWGKGGGKVERLTRLGTNLFVLGMRGGLRLDQKIGLDLDNPGPTT